MLKKLELKIPPPVLTIISILLMWGLAKMTASSSFFFSGQKAIAVILILIGIAFGLIGIFSFKKSSTTTNPSQPETTSQLVTSGIFKLSRNPMYLGIVWVLLGWLVFLGNLFSLLIPILFVLYLTQFQIKPEEKILCKKFGKAYETYKKSTRRWI